MPLKLEIVKPQSHSRRNYHPVSKPLKQLITEIDKVSSPKYDISKILNRYESEQVAPKSSKKLMMSEKLFRNSGHDDILPEAFVCPL